MLRLRLRFLSSDICDIAPFPPANFKRIAKNFHRLKSLIIFGGTFPWYLVNLDIKSGMRILSNLTNLINLRINLTLPLEFIPLFLLYMSSTKALTHLSLSLSCPTFLASDNLPKLLKNSSLESLPLSSSVEGYKFIFKLFSEAPKLSWLSLDITKRETVPPY